MKVINPLDKRDGLIAARASTEERLRADKLMSKLNLSSHGQLVRQLLEETAKALGMS